MTIMEPLDPPEVGDFPWGDDLNEDLERVYEAARAMQELVVAQQAVLDAVAELPELQAKVDQVMGVVATTDGLVGSVLRDPASSAFGALREWESQRVVNVLAFPGIDPTGATSSRAAVVAAVATLQPGDTLVFPRGTYRWDMWNPVVITTQRVTITGGGIIAGSFRFGTADLTRHIRARVIGLRFVQAIDYTAYPIYGYYRQQDIDPGAPNYGPGSAFISYDRVRQLRVEQCEFVGAQYAMLGLIHAGTGEHHQAFISMKTCHVNLVDYAWLTQEPTTSWTQHSDSRMIDVTVEMSYKGAVRWGQMDGATISECEFFSMNHASPTAERYTEKQQQVYIGQSDWVHVSGNQFFGSGLEGLLINGAKTAEVHGNNFAWTGQLVPSSAVKIVAHPSFDSTATVSGNTMKLYTKSALELVGNFLEITLGINACRYGTTTYNGDAAALAATLHYRYDLSGVAGMVTTQLQIADGSMATSNHHDRLPASANVMSAQRWDSFAGRATSRVTRTITASTQADVLSMTNLGDSATQYGALVFISVRAGTSSTSKTSSYVLHVHGRPGAPECKLISEAGHIGASAAVDDPSFSFAVGSNTLRATPRGVTAGSFVFEVTAIGDAMGR